MRPKVIFFVLLIGLIFMGIILFVSNLFHQPEAISQAEVVSQPEQTRSRGRIAIEKNHLPRQAESLPSGVANHAATTNSTNSELSAKYIRERKEEFYNLSMREDQNSLNILLSEMQNSNKEIRKAALESVVQFDDRTSIPRLQEIANQTDDPEEKSEILAAIDYIKLPSLSEYIAERKAYKAEMGITNKSRSVIRKPLINQPSVTP